MSESDMEKPAADAEEQRREVVAEPETVEEEPAGIPFDANEADAAEQRREVTSDDDDYR